jgi:hypothetical protein
MIPLATLLTGLGFIVFLASKPTGRRFLTGQHLDGIRRSDCTFLHPGRNGLDVSGRVSKWALLAGRQRASYRLTAIIVPTLFAAGLEQDPTLTITTSLTVGCAAATRPAIHAGRRLKLQRHTRAVTRPLADALGPVVGQDKGVRPVEWITCPLDYHTQGVTVTLPARFPGTEEQQQRVAAIASGKLGGEWEPTYNMAGPQPTLTLQHSPEPPSLVGWDDISEHLQQAPAHMPPLGLGSRAAPVGLDFDGDTPHVLVSVPSGGGKSVAARIIAAHVLHHGGQLLVLDYKRISQAWAADLPGVTYCRTAAEIHDALLALQREINDRYDNPADHRRLLVIIEELNSTKDLLQSYWQNNPNKRGLHRSPAVMALQDSLFRGREAKVHTLAMAQMGIADAFGSGGGAARENATPIIGASSSQNTWTMLAPGVTPPPKNPHPGRMYTLSSDIARAVQVGYLTDQQAQLWATTGVPAPPSVETDADDLSALGFGTL